MIWVNIGYYAVLREFTELVSADVLRKDLLELKHFY